MASAIEKSVQEATEELHAHKSSEGVSVNGAGKDEDRKMEDIENDMDDLEESHKGIFSKIKSFLGRSEGTEVSAAHVEQEVPEIDYGRDDKEKEQDEKTVDAPEDLGETESLDSLKSGMKRELEQMKDEPNEPSREVREQIDTGMQEKAPEPVEEEETEEPHDPEIEMDIDDSKPLGGPAEPEVAQREAEVKVEDETEEPVTETGVGGDRDTETGNTGPETQELEEEAAFHPSDLPEPGIQKRELADDVQEAPAEKDEEMPGPGAEEPEVDEHEPSHDVRETAGKSRKVDIERELKQLEEKIVDEESRELAKIQELEQRVQQLEMRDQEALEEKIIELEDRLETIKTPEELDDRMTELENTIMNPERNIQDLIGQGLKQELKQANETNERIEAELERLGEDQNDLESSIQEIRSDLKSLDSKLSEVDEQVSEDIERVDEKIEQLWEAMDNELATMENKVHENEAEVEELLSTVLELSELVKQAMDQ